MLTGMILDEKKEVVWANLTAKLKYEALNAGCQGAWRAARLMDEAAYEIDRLRIALKESKDEAEKLRCYIEIKEGQQNAELKNSDFPRNSGDV